MSVYSLTEDRISKRFEAPLQCYSFCKKYYASICFGKLRELRPEYGYSLLDPTLIDENSGIEIVDAANGAIKYSLSLDELQLFIGCSDISRLAKINHCQFSPNGEILLFMYRAFRKDGKHSYLLSWDYQRNKLSLLLREKVVSHYSWIDNETIIVWGKMHNRSGYHVLHLDAESYPLELKNPLLLGDGHPSYSNSSKKIVTDTYPNKQRMSTLFLLDINKIFFFNKFIIKNYFNNYILNNLI